jgi:hypothetical protein
MALKLCQGGDMHKFCVSYSNNGKNKFDKCVGLPPSNLVS